MPNQLGNTLIMCFRSYWWFNFLMHICLYSIILRSFNLLSEHSVRQTSILGFGLDHFASRPLPQTAHWVLEYTAGNWEVPCTYCQGRGTLPSAPTPMGHQLPLQNPGYAPEPYRNTPFILHCELLPAEYKLPSAISNTVKWDWRTISCTQMDVLTVVSLHSVYITYRIWLQHLVNDHSFQKPYGEQYTMWSRPGNFHMWSPRPWSHLNQDCDKS